MGDTHANFYSSEGTCTTETTITFPWRPRNITIINDSATTNLSFKFHSGETYGTLKPGESVSPDVISRQVILNSTNADYRVWGIG